jgi:hypothetical protein
MRSKGQAPVVKPLNQHLYKFVRAGISADTQGRRHCYGTIHPAMLSAREFARSIRKTVGMGKIRWAEAPARAILTGVN